MTLVPRPYQGKTAGVGYTRKYEAGRPMKGYLVKKAYRVPEGETLAEVRPGLFARGVDLSEILTKLLSQSWPRAFVERVQLSQRYYAPALGESFACCFYVTLNFRTGVHCDRDHGSALALGLFLERHRPGCRRPGHTCKKNWYFFLPELRIKIPLRHGMIIIWDSETRLHATTCDGQADGGCDSDVYVCVSQLKSSHYGGQ